MSTAETVRVAAVGMLILAFTTPGDAVHRPIVSSTPRARVRLVVETNFNDSLAQQYKRLMPNVDVQIVDAVGSVATFTAIQRGEADLGFVLADVAYLGYAQLTQDASKPAIQVRGIAALEPVAIHLLVRPGLHVESIHDLVGYRIGLGTALSGQSRLADLMFRAYRLGPGVVQQTNRRADLLAGVDATFATSYYPGATVTEAALLGAQLIPIDGPIAAQIRREYPFVRSVTIPAGTYHGQETDVTTLGVDRLLIGSARLNETLAHDLTRIFIETLPQLSSSLHTSLRLTNLEQASATPIPLHTGAAQYYRERELTR